MAAPDQDLEKNFCSSPWLHAHINNSGHYEYCRWATKSQRANRDHDIRSMTPGEYFQQALSPTRELLLNGQMPEGCRECHVMEQHGKVSGRERQLLKVGVMPQNFAKSLRSTAWFDVFRHSAEHQGHTHVQAQDWQIDLGNYCNGACVFCSPYSSSRLATEFKQIGIIQDLPPAAWCDQPELLQRFLQHLEQTPNLRYLHFIGGEPLIIPAFQKILAGLVRTGQAATVTVGFTTNLTTWDQTVFDLLDQFHQVNLGMSVECMHALNDYVRWPSEISRVTDMIQRWRSQGQTQKWLFQLRITPTVLSIWHLDSLYRYAMMHNINVESCNFLYEPAFMRPSVLPPDLRVQVQQRLRSVLPPGTDISTPVINTRDPTQAQQQIVQDVLSYCHYLDDEPDLSHLMPDLVAYLRRLEKHRGNSILHYLPEYETVLRSAGY
jgi:sulfatase maturation enzyme AslB (radical SAM superfamily)